MLAAALVPADISGLVTNRDLLVRVLESSEWRAGETTTDFFDRVGLSRLATPLVRVDEQPAYALAAAWGQAQLRRMVAPVLGSIPSGWRSNPSQPQQTAYTVGCRSRWPSATPSGPGARLSSMGQRLNLDGPPEVDSPDDPQCPDQPFSRRSPSGLRGTGRQRAGPALLCRRRGFTSGAPKDR